MGQLLLSEEMSGGTCRGTSTAPNPSHSPLSLTEPLQAVEPLHKLILLCEAVVVAG